MKLLPIPVAWAILWGSDNVIVPTPTTLSYENVVTPTVLSPTLTVIIPLVWPKDAVDIDSDFAYSQVNANPVILISSPTTNPCGFVVVIVVIPVTELYPALVISLGV